MLNTEKYISTGSVTCPSQAGGAPVSPKISGPHLRRDGLA